MSFSRRRLPHIHPEGIWLFVTWHLDGSLPQALFPPPGKYSDGKAFVWMDCYLDTTRKGPQYLRRPEIAAIVARSILRGVALGHYQLRVWVVMANHVHVLLLPLISPSRLLQSLKGHTAREANLILERTGRRFWQAESYDHWVRDELELERIAAYIEGNPVKAGFVDSAAKYRWSSAGTCVETSNQRGCARHGSRKLRENSRSEMRRAMADDTLARSCP
jgi:putative transposase